MNKPLSVTALNLQIKSLLESTFLSVYVEGEVSNLTYHNSGHIYFSVKDSSSTISCVMFKSNAASLKFRLEHGMKIIISGAITLYTPRGNYQIICSKISPQGTGDLSLAYEQLKTKLQQKGWFDTSRKKVLPKFPRSIAIVTSATGAAIEDMKSVAHKRYSLCKLILIPTLVQGNCKEDIAASIAYADSLQCDIMIVGRGGGSLEDLWGFNEEIVAQAIYEAQTPIISAVGHEIDYAISDFVADIRAATPSNAMEIALPDTNELQLYLHHLSESFNARTQQKVESCGNTLDHLYTAFKQNSITHKFQLKSNETTLLKEALKQKLLNHLTLKSNEIKVLQHSFENSKQAKTLKKGLAQISKEGRILDLEEVSLEDEIVLQNNTISIKAIVKDKQTMLQ
jgi:exodeoxyribonuclease VII large subunit